MGWVLQRAGEIKDNVEADSINVEKYVRELAAVVIDLTKASGKMFEQEHLRMINMVSAINTGGSGATGGPRFNRGIMEHKVIQNLRAVNGDKGLFRQWHQKFTTALGQVKAEYEEIVHRLAREIDLGKEMEAILTMMENNYGAMFREASSETWEILIDKARRRHTTRSKPFNMDTGSRHTECCTAGSLTCLVWAWPSKPGD